MKTKQSMDLFGEALEAYSQGDRSPFYLKDRSGELSRTDLSRHFRKPDQLSKFEKKLISLAYGDILDVGCGTGNYIPLMSKRGRVLGLDRSPKVIDVAKKTGCKNCKVADIFTFSTATKYDTISFLGNNLGIGGTVNKTRKLLKKLSSLLKNDGQILAIGRRVIHKKFVEVQLRPVWKQQIGSRFDWIHISKDFLSDLCEQAGLRLKVLQGNQHYYLFRIVKK
ncbi:MAG: class I SAM-dependent methyltransferase [Candidatus Zixiibacteriota bacterium]|nr:MAG: class I SAM-dependent methyltransferase [candidate division Zixibacteria bacterium]